MSSKSDRVIELLRKAGSGGLHIEEIAEQLSQHEGTVVTVECARSAIDGARNSYRAPIYNKKKGSCIFAYLPERGPWK